MISTPWGKQVKKLVEEFGCERVTFVGDRGRIKSGQIDELKRAGFHYITAITKPQIERLLREGVFQMGLFDEDVFEVEDEGTRYILRRNPQRAEEVACTRKEKERSNRKMVSLGERTLSRTSPS